MTKMHGMSILARLKRWLSPTAKRAHREKLRRIDMVNADPRAGKLVFPRDPYRTSPVTISDVAFEAQKRFDVMTPLQRQRYIVDNMRIGAVSQDPVRRAADAKQLRDAENKLYALMTQHPRGAGGSS